MLGLRERKGYRLRSNQDSEVCIIKLVAVVVAAALAVPAVASFFRSQLLTPARVDRTGASRTRLL